MITYEFSLILKQMLSNGLQLHVQKKVQKKKLKMCAMIDMIDAAEILVLTQCNITTTLQTLQRKAQDQHQGSTQ